MFRVIGIMILLASVSFSQNVIDTGVWRLGGGVGMTKYSDMFDSHTYYYVSPRAEYFVNKNVGLGVHADLMYSPNYSWGSKTEILLTPIVSLVTEKPYWPIYFTIGPSIFTESYDDEFSDRLFGLYLETGVLLFINEHVAITPKYSIHYDSDTYDENISRLSVAFEIFFATEKLN